MDLTPCDKPIAVAMGAKRGGKDASSRPPAPMQVQDAASWTIWVNRSFSVRHVRIAILGAGTAGLTALSQVRKHTDDFVIINHGPYGTTCARVGCMP